MDPNVYKVGPPTQQPKKTPWLQALIQSHWSKTIVIGVVVSGVLLIAFLNLGSQQTNPADGKYKHPGPKYEVRGCVHA
jgi:hypothetical protein